MNWAGKKKDKVDDQNRHIYIASFRNNNNKTIE